MSVSEEIEKTPTGNTAVNEPESGTYGEKADLNRLKPVSYTHLTLPTKA